MDFKIEKYLLKKAEELAFITIKHGGEFKLKSYEVPKGGLDVPIKNEVLVKGIKEKTAQDKLNSMSIADAMIYIIGIDSKFKNNAEYEKFLNALSKDIDLDLKSYMGYMSRKYFEIGEHTDSLIYIKAFITMYPDDLDAMYNYAIVCQEIAKQYQKDMDDKAMNAFLLEAMAKLEKVIDVDENFALGYYHLGYHYYNQGQYLKTKLTWEEALRLGLDADLVAEVQENLGKMDFKVQYEEGYTLVFQGKFKEGLEKLLPLEEEHMDWWNLLFMIALGYKGMDEIEQAKMYLEKILIIKPNQVDTIVELGLCEAYKNNLDKAIEYFEQAAKIKEDPEILCNLGMAYLNNGDIDDATYYIERAYELNPQDEITIACLRELGINK
ncbi:TPA: tetratricopeptide repeat protein [Clostridioides difficile]|uniref:TPR domain-containing protein n=1 Tax=Clostridioides difficile ATCC 9689 = DSM 1296 TaxID=1121308 RepID=A0AC59FWR9_CLODI|nr:tetratricopeptide repeat protein [Clostridioides difficile]AKP41771.1 TPR domain-containing protein [Clostridioides difficile ATCC 9689 = DSM 1296]ARC14597.1 tetratricopeptide repeat protein [Clostridioides difficile]AVI11369.1 tetratricopeptide repeat protein [Clostridioides difficile]AXU85642.1 TPR domain-containing protein [Clostridioides difficile]AYC92683.1 tetratricopeptide repeat protein [Clostridioides difficile]